MAKSEVGKALKKYRRDKRLRKAESSAEKDPTPDAGPLLYSTTHCLRCPGRLRVRQHKAGDYYYHCVKCDYTRPV